jgi:hypothetical protein
VPTTVDGRVGGTLAFDFGGGMVSGAQITEWEPPRRLVAEDKTWLQGGPPVATEWTVQARAGGTCVVRVVHSLFATTDTWDDQLESTEKGWPGFFRVLSFYLTHHAGERAASMQTMAMGAGPTEAMWATLLQALGIEAPRHGQHVSLQANGGTQLVATVEHVDRTANGHCLQLRVVEPVPGIVLAGAFACSGMQMATFQAWFYGDRAESVARDREHLAASAHAGVPEPAGDSAGELSAPSVQFVKRTIKP